MQDGVKSDQRGPRSTEAVLVSVHATKLEHSAPHPCMPPGVERETRGRLHLPIVRQHPKNELPVDRVGNLVLAVDFRDQAQS